MEPIPEVPRKRNTVSCASKAQNMGSLCSQNLSLKCCKRTAYPSVFVPSLILIQSLEFPPTKPANALWKLVSPERHLLSPPINSRLCGQAKTRRPGSTFILFPSWGPWLGTNNQRGPVCDFPRPRTRYQPLLAGNFYGKGLKSFNLPRTVNWPTGCFCGNPPVHCRRMP